MAFTTDYMTVLKKTESQLRLLREPTFLSKAVFIGFSVGVTGVILFGSESCLFKVLIGFGAIFLSCFMVDNYEICDLNKETSEIHLTRMHFCQYFLGNLLSPRPFVTSKLPDIQEVRVESQDTGDAKKSHRVVLVLKSGIQLALTEVCTTDDVSEHEKIVDVVRLFLGIVPLKKSPKLLEEDDDAEYEGDGSSSSDDGNDVDCEEEDDDDFEQITKSDIETLEAEEEDAAITGRGDTAETVVDEDNTKQDPKPQA